MTKFNVYHNKWNGDEEEEVLHLKVEADAVSVDERGVLGFAVLNDDGDPELSCALNSHQWTRFERVGG